MSTNFPTSLDTYADVSGSTVVPSAGWNNIQDAIEALEAKVGVDGSAVSSSLDYKVSALETSASEISDAVDDATEAIATIEATKQGALKSSRLLITAASDTTLTLEVTSISDGDTQDAETVNKDQNTSTYYQTEDDNPYYEITVKAAAFASSVTQLLYAVIVSKPAAWVQHYVVPSISSGGIKFTLSLRGPSFVLDLYGTTEKKIIIDFIYR